MKVVALAGGTGSAKLLRGLCELDVDLTVVANVGDNFWVYGVYVCPDVDIAMYTLAGMADSKKGWGIRRDTFHALDGLSRLGVDAWFRLGDRDLATCILRTEMMRSGASLTEATERLCGRLGATVRVLPASDDPLETHVLTSKGELHLQEFWVREGGRPHVTGVEFMGAGRAAPTKEVTRAIGRADRIVVCPANPVTSIGPMLAMRGFRGVLEASKARVVALSPMIGGAPYSGPAGKLARAMGLDPNSAGVAKLYRGFLDAIMISEMDASELTPIEGMGIRCLAGETRIKVHADALRLAKELLEA